jgi:hypothetical protein
MIIAVVPNTISTTITMIIIPMCDEPSLSLPVVVSVGIVTLLSVVSAGVVLVALGSGV